MPIIVDLYNSTHGLDPFRRSVTRVTSVVIHGNLQLNISRTPLGHAIERRLGILHRIGVGDEWLQIQFTVSHEVNGLLIHIGITEDIFDAHLGSLQFRNVDSHRTDRNANDNGSATGSNQLPECLV